MTDCGNNTVMAPLDAFECVRESPVVVVKLRRPVLAVIHNGIIPPRLTLAAAIAVGVFRRRRRICAFLYTGVFSCLAQDALLFTRVLVWSYESIPNF